MTALCVIVLYMASVLPTLKLTACVIAAAVVCVSMIKLNTKGALAVFVSSSVVALIILPEKLIALAYLLFFGNYPIIKSFIERKNSLKKEWVLKVAVFLVYDVIAVLLLHIFMYGILMILFTTYPIAFVCAAVSVFAGEIVFDIVLSFFITEIQRRFTKLKL